jgi:ubiquinone/menaquinone biosynthesis C-methylase UbiE
VTKNPDDQAVSETVRKFYDEYGWRADGDGLGEDKQFRQASAPFKRYSERSTARVMQAFEAFSGSILFVGPGDMPDSHVALAKRFDSVTCIDISSVGLDVARSKLGDAARYVVGSIVDSDLPSDGFDAVYCAHVLYHIDKTQQETAMREMIRLAKPGGRIVVLYANPASPFRLPGRLMKAVRGAGKSSGDTPLGLYYFEYPLRWWSRFADQCTVAIQPWEAVAGRIADVIFRPRFVAAGFVKAALALETASPGLAVALWQYPMIVLDKRTGGAVQE